VACPAGTYAEAAGAVCLDCPRGCDNCSSSAQCFSCFSHYYFNATLGFCFSCHSVCLNCSGPGQTDCTACQSPLVVYRSTCAVLECSVGYYVEPNSGCTPCSSKFVGSGQCNYSQPLACVGPYLFNGTFCLSCSQVTGYTLLPSGKCG
jgi:proprotein convertase subtilisin/kexin type 5